ncbi:MAG: hypothetical protein AAGH76_03075 [Pseudomonadota bacterium]
MSSEQVYVQPFLLQDELAVQVVIQDSSASTAQFGLIGALVGSAIDSAINNSRAKQAERKAEVLREATSSYRLVVNYRETVDVESSGSGWSVISTGEVSADTDTRDTVEKILEDSNVTAVAVLSGNYQLVPTLDQVSVSITQDIYRRPDKSSTRLRPDTTKVFQYLSPRHPVDYRSFVAGEKELLKTSITTQYEQAIATQPDEEKTLRKALEEELDELDESETVPDDVAIAETWNGDLLIKYLEQSKQHLRFMVEYDWNERVVPETDKESLQEYFVVNDFGVNAKVKGRYIGMLDSNTIYRAQYGAIHSVPSAAPEQ